MRAPGLLLLVALIAASCARPSTGADPAAPDGGRPGPSPSSRAVGPLTATVLARVVLTMADAPPGVREITTEDGYLSLAGWLDGAPQQLMDSILNDPAFVDARSRRFGTADPGALRGSWAALYVDGQEASRALRQFRDWFGSSWLPGGSATDPGLGDEGFRLDGTPARGFGRRLVVWMWREDNLLLRAIERDPGPWSAREIAETMDSRIR